MSDERIVRVIEAALMVADGPLSLDRLQSLFAPELGLQVERDELRAALAALGEQYADRGVELREVASGWRFQARTELAPWVNRLWEERPPRYSRALLETLAIIAYRQPITRGEIEDIRGVAVSPNIIKTLLEREWVRVAGHRDVPGRPAVYVTTREFLDYFNLKSLSELPSLAELRDIDDINLDLFGEAANQGAGETTSSGDGETSAAAVGGDVPGDESSGAGEENATAVPVALSESGDSADHVEPHDVPMPTDDDEDAGEAVEDDTAEPTHTQQSAAAAK